MIAHLGMYERPETAAAHDRYWALIRDRLRAAGLAAPQALTRGGDFWAIWQDPSLVLSQTCGLPYRARLHGRVALVGTPDFALPGLPAGHYNSVVIQRADDGRDPAAIAGARLAYNDALSQSGWAAAQELGLDPAEKLCTGSHRASALAVAEDRADVACIDAVTWRNLDRFEPALTARLRVARCTSPVPGLPYVTAPAHDPMDVALAVGQAMSALDPADRDLLGLAGLARIPAADYLALPIPPRP